MSDAPEQSRSQVHWITVVLAAAAVAAIGMGLRQTMGLFQKPMTMALGLTSADFSLGIAVANLVWGFAAPVTGAMADRQGAGRVVVLGAAATALGLYFMSAAASRLDLIVSGVLLGIGIAGAGVNALVGTVARAAPPEKRTQAVAAIGMGSGLGILIALPYTHLLMDALGWKQTLLVLTATAALILPLAIPLSGGPAAPVQVGPKQSLGAALSEAARHPSFWLLNAGFFVCGFHVVYYGVHLPAYVASKGLDSKVAVGGLVLVGVGNLIGTYLAGQSGRWMEKRRALSLIYAIRASIFLGFLFLPITPATVLVLSFALGLVWLSTIPLTSGLVGTFYGPAWMTMLYGVVFLSHQIGSFLGVWLGGIVYDATKSYDLMWWISVALGLLAALANWPIKEQAVQRALLPASAT